MSTTIYIASIDRAGKTALSAVIGKNLQEKGKNVGFFIPVKLTDGLDFDGYKDAGFFKQEFNLGETVEMISPNHISSINLWRGMTGEDVELMQKIKNSYDLVAKDKDVMIVEGLSGLVTDGVTTSECLKISEALNAKVLALSRYSDAFDVSILTGVKFELGDKFAGLIVNFAPAAKLEKIKEDLTVKGADTGINLLAVIPEDRGLLSLTVAEVAERLGGEIITGKKNTGRIIENIMLGSLSLDQGTNYLNRKTNKALIVRSERSDIQLAAMESSTVCLILTGITSPFYQVVNQAEDKGVPMILVKKDTESVIAAIEDELLKNSFDDRQKLVRFIRLTKQAIDFPSLYKALGLAD